MTESIISFAVGGSVVVNNYGIEYPGRVIAVDLKGDRPIAVAFEREGKESIFKFKKDGSTSVSQLCVTRAPAVRCEYRTLGFFKHGFTLDKYHVGAVPFRDLEKLKNTFPDSKSQLKFTYVDEEITSVELIKE